MKKLIVHIGYPKTATTSMQENLFAELMRDRKIEYLNHVNKTDLYFSDFFVKEIVHYITGESLSKDFRGEISKLNSLEKKVSLISAEKISVFHENFSWANLSSKSIENIGRIEEVFSSIYDEIHIIISVRAQENIIPSFYAEHYYDIKAAESKYKNISNWFNANFIFQTNGVNLPFNFDLMYKKCSAVFGKENTHVLLFEDLSNEPNKIHKDLAEIFNVPIPYVRKKMNNKILNSTKNSAEGKKLTSRPTINNYLMTYLGRPLKKKLSESFTKRLKNIYLSNVPEAVRKLEVDVKTAFNDLEEEKINLIHDQYDDLNYKFLNRCDVPESKMKLYKYIR